MTIDFSQGTGKLYFQGTKPSATKWYVEFDSEYSNTKLAFADSGNDRFQLSLVTDETETNWYSFTWVSSYNRNRDIAGYYNMTLFGDDSRQFDRLVKVNNDQGIVDTVYTTTSAKENNEQIVYFR